MGFRFCDLHVSLNNPSSGDINSSNLPCSFCKIVPFKTGFTYITVHSYGPQT